MKPKKPQYDLMCECGDLVKERIIVILGTWPTRSGAEDAMQGFKEVLRKTRPEWTVCKFWVE